MSMSWSPVLSGLSQGGFPNLRQEGQESEEERHRNISQYVSAAASEIESRREDLSQQRDERDEQEDRKHKDFGGGSDEEMMHGGVGLNEEEFVFDAETVGLRDIARVLSCLQVARGGGGSGGGKAPKARQQVLAVLRLAKEGIKFYIKGDRDYAAHTTLNADWFERYEYRGVHDFTEMIINFTTFMECIAMHGVNMSTHTTADPPKLRMLYGPMGSTLILKLSDGEGNQGNMFTECGLRILTDFTNVSGPQFDTYGIEPSRIDCSAVLLREAFAGFDFAAPKCTVEMKPEAAQQQQQSSEPMLTIQCESDYDISTVSYPSSVLDEFAVEIDICYKYKMQLFLPVAKALPQVEKVRIEINQLGVMRLQMINFASHNKIAMIEFILVPEEDD